MKHHNGNLQYNPHLHLQPHTYTQSLIWNISICKLVFLLRVQMYSIPLSLSFFLSLSPSWPTSHVSITQFILKCDNPFCMPWQFITTSLTLSSCNDASSVILALSHMHSVANIHTHNLILTDTFPHTYVCMFMFIKVFRWNHLMQFA